MSAGMAIVFGTVIANIFNSRVSPKGPRLREEHLHNVKDINIEQDGNCANNELEFTRKQDISDQERNSNESRVD